MKWEDKWMESAARAQACGGHHQHASTVSPRPTHNPAQIMPVCQPHTHPQPPTHATHLDEQRGLGEVEVGLPAVQGNLELVQLCSALYYGRGELVRWFVGSLVRC